MNPVLESAGVSMAGFEPYLGTFSISLRCGYRMLVRPVDVWLVVQCLVGQGSELVPRLLPSWHSLTYGRLRDRRLVAISLNAGA